VAAGELLVLDAPLSFWGGVDPAGRVVDVHHPQHGDVLAGRVVAMPSGRGSSSSSSVLAEQIRTGSAPAAVLIVEADAIVVLGALVAAELYDRSMPIVQVSPDVLAALPRSGHVEVHADDEVRPGVVRIEINGGPGGREEESDGG
jgi:predicted aconitase with swiveling domain